MPKPFQSGDSRARHFAHREDAGANGLAVDVDGAGAALREAAPELGRVEVQLVAEDVQQWSFGGPPGPCGLDH